MDPSMLATAVTSLLAPYLAKAGGAILDRATAALPDAAANLWNTVTKHFEGKPAAAAASDLAQKPSDEDQQALFAAQLKIALKNDPDFAAAVEELLKKASPEQQGGHNVTITTGNIAGNTGSSIAIGTNANAKNG
jgi:hypothetical protein